MKARVIKPITLTLEKGMVIEFNDLPFVKISEFFEEVTEEKKEVKRTRAKKGE